MQIQLWNERTEINGISMEQILANRQDLQSAGVENIFLVVDEYDKVREIQIASTIAGNYGLDANLLVREVGEAYIAKKEEEERLAEQERITNEELQEEVAVLSYEVMMLQPEDNNVSISALVVENEEHSPKFKLIKNWYDRGFWTDDMVQNAVNKGKITQGEYNEIVIK